MLRSDGRRLLTIILPPNVGNNKLRSWITLNISEDGEDGDGMDRIEEVEMMLCHLSQFLLNLLSRILN